MAKRGNNEGSIHKRENGTWRAQVSIEGKRLSYTGNTRVECHDWLRRTMDLVDHGLTLQSRHLSLQEYLKDWFEIKKTTLRPRTAYDYERLLTTNIFPELGQIKLKDLTTYRITKFYTKLSQAGKGSRTVRLTHSILHSALQSALESGVISRNPTIGTMLPRYNQKEMNVLNESQVSQFLIAAEKSRYKCLYHLAITTGMRYSELVGLKWSDIDWVKGTIKVQRQLQFVPHQGFTYSEPKTKSGIRTIKLGDTTLKILREQKERQIQNKIPKDDLIFLNSYGTQVYFKRFQKDFKRVLRQAGLPDIRFHDLRHTAATLMIANGIPVLIVARILGHSKPSVTMNVYGHSSVEMQSDAAKLMENLVTPIPISLEKSSGGKDIENRLHPVAPELQKPDSSKNQPPTSGGN